MVPQELRYAETHEWLKVDGDAGTVGITKFAVDQLTDVVFIDLKKAVGEHINAGQTFGEIESVKAVSDLYAPVSGEITAVNSEVVNNPASVSADPFGKGWLIKVKVVGGAEKLMSAGQYEKQISTQGH